MLGGLGSSLYLLRRELGSLMCLRIALSEHGASIYSMIWTASPPNQTASFYHACGVLQCLTKEPVSSSTCTDGTTRIVSFRTSQSIKPGQQLWESCALTTQPRVLTASVQISIDSPSILFTLPLFGQIRHLKSVLADSVTLFWHIYNIRPVLAGGVTLCWIFVT